MVVIKLDSKFGTNKTCNTWTMKLNIGPLKSQLLAVLYLAILAVLVK
jgi:hypothetical protein